MLGQLFISSIILAIAMGAPQQQYRPNPPPYQPIQDESLKPYSYQYSVVDADSGADFGAQESADGRVVSGSYSVKLPDGRTQTVTYTVEGDSGFVADVQYEGAPVYAPQGPQRQPSYYV